MEEVDYENLIDPESKKWIQSQLEEETKRLQASGMNPLILSLKKFSQSLQKTVTDQKLVSFQIINKVYFQTAFDFSRVLNILYKPPVPFPNRLGWQFSIIVLMTEHHEVPILFPYLFDAEEMILDEEGNKLEMKKGKKMMKRKQAFKVSNSLNQWIFVNSIGQECKLKIKEFEDVVGQ